MASRASSLPKRSREPYLAHTKAQAEGCRRATQGSRSRNARDGSASQARGAWKECTDVADCIAEVLSAAQNAAVSVDENMADQQFIDTSFAPKCTPYCS